MLARLGHVLYGLGWGLAAAALVSGVFLLQHGVDPDYRGLSMSCPSGVLPCVGCSDGPANTSWPANERRMIRLSLRSALL
jgi:hypothetical protein